MRGVADSLTNYQSILVDYRGHGRSRYKKPDSTWATINHITQDVELVRRHLGIDEWTLIGNSYGSHFALNYAVMYPQHTSRVILTASPGTNNQFLVYYSDNINMRYSEKDKEDLENLPDGSNLLDRKRIQFRPYFFDKTKTSVVFSAPEEEIPFFYNRNYFIAAVTRPGFEDWDISAQVYRLDLPIRIIQGRQDPVNGMEIILNERAKNSKLIYIERAGHFPWAEQPSAFFAALRESLND